MEMVFRWFGEDNDHVRLDQIKQIPDVKGIVWSLHHVAAGEKWPINKIMEVHKQATEHKLHIKVVESVNVHEDIKLGRPTRDHYIENYKETIRELGKVGVEVICYNFMPVFDWIRTNLHKELEDGSTALFYEKKMIEGTEPSKIVASVLKNKSFTLPGWEPERLEQLQEVLEAYKMVDEEKLWANLQYFLKEVVPVAEECNIKLAIHPDDPPWSVFGLPRIVTTEENIGRIINLVDSPSNGITFCSGALGANPNNDLVNIIRKYGERIHFAHVRNLKRFDNGDFIETAHKMSYGSIDMVGVMEAFYNIGYTGYIRPDHGRDIWGEVGRPGYGLYDRALGAMYLFGLWDAISRRGGKDEYSA
nr:mannonate dehydratase [Lysinibacillus timonensis]